MAKANYDQNHLTYEQRLEIQKLLKEHLSLKEIGKRLYKDPTTVSKEIKKHRYAKEAMKKFQINSIMCSARDTCRIRNLCHCIKSCGIQCRACRARDCTLICKKFIVKTCKKHDRFPYVCNSCPTVPSCPLTRFYYDAKLAHNEYERENFCNRRR